MTQEALVAVHGKWVLSTKGDELNVTENQWVVCEGDTVAGLYPQPPADSIQHHVPDALVMPGLINCHNHGVSSVMFRGLTEDWPAASFETELIYGLLMPLNDVATATLTQEELGHVMELALLEIIKGGATTLMEVFRPTQAATFDVARDLGLRFYGAPYLFSAARMDMDETGNPTYAVVEQEQSDIDRFRQFHQTYDGAENGRLRVSIGPHGLDSCEPELLQSARDLANELGVLINVHVCQTQAEVALLNDRFNKTPSEFMESVGLLGPDVLAAHCLHASDDDLKRLAASDTTIVNCPMTFARGGVTAAYERFHAAGARTVIGTDGYYMDIVAELRAAGIISKLTGHDSGVASAHQLLKAATLDGAAALHRPDLGRLEPGAKADLVAVSLAKPHFQPVSDPLKTYLWNARGAEVSLMLVDGVPLIDDGKFLPKSEQTIIEQADRAIRKVWRAAADAGIRHVPEV